MTLTFNVFSSQVSALPPALIFSFAAVVMPQDARPLPFQYQFAAGAVAGVSEVRSLQSSSRLYPTDRN